MKHTIETQPFLVQDFIEKERQRAVFAFNQVADPCPENQPVMDSLAHVAAEDTPGQEYMPFRGIVLGVLVGAFLWLALWCGGRGLYGLYLLIRGLS